MLGEVNLKSPLSFMLVGRNLLCLTVFGVIYFTIILVLEYRLFAKCMWKRLVEKGIGEQRPNGRGRW